MPKFIFLSLTEFWVVTVDSTHARAHARTQRSKFSSSFQPR